MLPIQKMTHRTIARSAVHYMCVWVGIQGYGGPGEPGVPLAIARILTVQSTSRMFL